MLYAENVLSYDDMCEVVETTLLDAHSGHPKLGAMIRKKKSGVFSYRNKNFVHESDIETYLESYYGTIMECCGQAFTFNDILMELDYLEVCDTIWYVLDKLL